MREEPDAIRAHNAIHFAQKGDLGSDIMQTIKAEETIKGRISEREGQIRINAERRPLRNDELACEEEIHEVAIGHDNLQFRLKRPEDRASMSRTAQQVEHAPDRFLPACITEDDKRGNCPKKTGIRWAMKEIVGIATWAGGLQHCLKTTLKLYGIVE
jgi:hypothetical protein